MTRHEDVLDESVLSSRRRSAVVYETNVQS